MRNILLWVLFVLMGTPLLSGCVKKIPPPPWVANISGIQEPIGSEEIFRLPEGERIPFSELLDDLGAARIIFIGESHDQIEHHLNQVKVLQGLLEKGKEV